jgi:16S rRNA (guanine(966)-N(2))-methyltransferase RsmD
MRIIAGEFRGRRLLGPEGDAVTRPITDRVKQSVFDILSPMLEDAIIYDCFAGSGSMGLECLSRGSAQAIFFEADRSALQRLQANIEALKVADRSRVVGGNLFQYFARTPEPATKANIIFLDPPYRLLQESPAELKNLAGIFAARHLAPDGIVVFRHSTDDSLDLAPLQKADVREYGSMVVEFLHA